MKVLATQFTFIVFFVIFPKGLLSVPHEYCLSPMNKSDCGYRPTAVFSYYKPGSRCEIEVWKGCPTMNKFDDEFICSHYCIGKLFRKHTVEFDANADPCVQPMNNKDCGGEPIEVFTYTDGTCTEAIWRGCPTLNKYKDQQTCQITCANNLDVWIKEVDKLLVEDIVVVEKILDNIIQDIGADEHDEEPVSDISEEEETKEETTEKESTNEEEETTEKETTNEEEETTEKIETNEEETTTEKEETKEDLLLHDNTENKVSSAEPNADEVITT